MIQDLLVLVSVVDSRPSVCRLQIHKYRLSGAVGVRGTPVLRSSTNAIMCCVIGDSIMLAEAKQNDVRGKEIQEVELLTS